MGRRITVKITRASRLVGVAIMLSSVIMPLISSSAVMAADLSQATVRFDSMDISSTTTGTVCAKPTSTATEADVQVTFPTGYTLGIATTFTVNTTNLAWPTGGTAWPSIATATNVTGQVATFPSGELTVGTLYCFNWANPAAVTVKATATSSNTGTVATRTLVPAVIDSATYSTASLTLDTITVSAIVPATFSFAVSASTDPIGTLSAASVATSPTPRTATLSTNAKAGWMVWAKDTNTGLTSATAVTTIPSRTPGTNSTLTAGTLGYNTGVTSTQVGGSGTIVIAAPFAGVAAGQGGGLDTTFRTLASSNGTADTAVLTLKNNATIGNITAAAADYADVITVVGAGLF